MLVQFHDLPGRIVEYAPAVAVLLFLQIRADRRLAALTKVVTDELRRCLAIVEGDKPDAPTDTE